MQIFTRPVWKYEKAHEDANSTTNSNGVQPLTSNLQHIRLSEARYGDQIEGKNEDHYTIIIVLFNTRYKPHVCCSKTYQITNAVKFSACKITQRKATQSDKLI